MVGLTHVWPISAYPHGQFPTTRYPAAMRNVIAGFIAGLLVGAAVTGAGPPISGDPGSRSRPDRLWEQDRGSTPREWMQRHEQERSLQQQQHNLTEEIDRLKHEPC